MPEITVPTPAAPSLKRDALWTAVDTFAAAGLAFLFRLVVARILSPDDFGVAAIVLAVVAVLQVVNDFGLTSALIQKSEDRATPALINTTFTASMMISVLLIMAVVTIVAPVSAWYYSEPSVEPLMIVLAWSLLPSPFSTVAGALLSRRRRFRDLAAVRVGSNVLSLVVAGMLLIWYPSPWVLIWQANVAAIASALGLVVMARWRFRFVVDRGHLREVFGFSSYVLLNDLLVTFGGNFAVLILARMVSPSEAGIYGLAVYVTDVVRRALSSIFNRVMIVHYSSLQHDKPALRTAFVSSLQWNCRIVFPIMAVMGLFGGSILAHFLGHQWTAMTSVVRWLSLTAAILTMGGASSTLYKAMGRPGLDLVIAIVTTFLIVFPALYFGAWLGGLVGTAMATALARLMNVIVRQMVLDRLLAGSLLRAARAVGRAIVWQWPIVAAWACMTASNADQWWQALLWGGGGLSLYAILTFRDLFEGTSLRVRKMLIVNRN